MQESHNYYLDHFIKSWKLVALRGVLAILFGIMAFAWPIAAVWSLTIVWGAYAFVDGVAALGTGWKVHANGERWWPYLCFGLIGIMAGLVTMIMPLFTTLVLVYCVGFWGVFGGLFQIIAAFQVKKGITNGWLLVLLGVLTMLFGLLILSQPEAGAFFLMYMLATFSLLFGGGALYMAYTMKKMSSSST